MGRKNENRMEKVVMHGDSVMGVNNKACWTVRALFAASEEYLGFGFPTPHPIRNL